MKKQQKTHKVFSQIWFAANAVSYRIPLPVIEAVELGRMESFFPVCPRCSCSMEREYMAFCNRCGQHLSWGVLQWADVVDIDDEKSLEISK